MGPEVRNTNEEDREECGGGTNSLEGVPRDLNSGTSKTRQLFRKYSCYTKDWLGLDRREARLAMEKAARSLCIGPG